ncbi:hypothetical protein JKP88DRAFT_204889 [Tribonema minus]|uniref:Ribosomal silencing factor RsfS n=1 Tax=Tribonema minus TaxID=303371 RepID=A0A836CM28_9STRA|nr:hypothetical protein JKP88DRAFT_204889 [Tribonema minus]
MATTLLRPVIRQGARALPRVCLLCARASTTDTSAGSSKANVQAGAKQPAAKNPTATSSGAKSPAGTAAGPDRSAVKARSWTWSSNAPRKAGGSADIDVKPKVPLTVGEVVTALENNGGTDIRVVHLAGKSDLADAMIFCTGRSMRHMQRLSDVITYALKRRKLSHAPGITGAEGYDCDDWMIVDCWNLIVHVFEAKYRKELNLEARWENIKPYNPKDWVNHLDYDSEDDEDSDEADGEEEEEGAAEGGGWSEGGRVPQTPAEEKREADRIAALWEAHIADTGIARKAGGRRKGPGGGKGV